MQDENNSDEFSEMSKQIFEIEFWKDTITPKLISHLFEYEKILERIKIKEKIPISEILNDSAFVETVKSYAHNASKNGYSTDDIKNIVFSTIVAAYHWNDSKIGIDIIKNFYDYKNPNFAVDISGILTETSESISTYGSEPFMRTLSFLLSEEGERTTKILNEDEKIMFFFYFLEEGKDFAMNYSDFLREFGEGKEKIRSNLQDAIAEMYSEKEFWKETFTTLRKYVKHPDTAAKILESIADHALDTEEEMRIARIDDVVNTLSRGYSKNGIWYILNGLQEVYDATKDENTIKGLCRSLDKIYERDQTTALLVAENMLDIIHVFNDKYEGIMSYIGKRNDRESLFAIGRINNIEKVATEISQITLDDFGNKQAERLIKLATYLDYNYSLGLEPEISENLQDSFKNAEDSLKNYARQIGVDLDRAIKFLPWLSTKDETALKVLRGEKVEKFGESHEYALSSSSVSLDEIRKELQQYANMARLNITIKEGDLQYLKSTAQYIMSQINKSCNDFNVLAEVRPNLGRILNMTYKGSRNYTLSINPSDLESQMKALQNITSCMSPSGEMFKYTRDYLKNPYTFWAVIKDGDDAVGRVTVFVGKQFDKNMIARVSKVYSIAPVNEKEIDKALKEYAREIGAEFLESGEMEVAGLEKYYDDFLGAGKGKIVVNRKNVALAYAMTR